MISFDNKKLKKEYYDLMTMRELSIDGSIPFDQQMEIRKEQLKKYHHYKFMMDLQHAIRNGGDDYDLDSDSIEYKGNEKEIHGCKNL